MEDKRNRNIMIAVVVILVLCCCCIILGVSYQFGDQIFAPFLN